MRKGSPSGCRQGDHRAGICRHPSAQAPRPPASDRAYLIVVAHGARLKDVLDREVRVNAGNRGVRIASRGASCIEIVHMMVLSRDVRLLYYGEVTPASGPEATFTLDTRTSTPT